MRSQKITLLLWALIFLAGRMEAAPGSKAKDAAVEPDQRSFMSLEDLGFSKDDMKSDPQLQKDLEVRSDMLRVHQTFGLATAAVMTTQYVVGLSTERSVSNGNSDIGFHATLGIGTLSLYMTTASFALFAPKPKDLSPNGGTELHQILALVHGPLMILTPLLGGMANDRISSGQPVGDLGALHGVAATALLTSYLAAMTVQIFNF